MELENSVQQALATSFDLAQFSKRLNRDIFLVFVDNFILLLRSAVQKSGTKLSPELDALLSLGRALRITCKAADLKLSPYINPYLVVTSRAQVTRLIQSRLINEHSLRSLTLSTLATPSILNAFLFHLQWGPAFRRLTHLIVDDRKDISTPVPGHRVPNFSALFVPKKARQVSVITSSDFDRGQHDDIILTAADGNCSDLRLALYGVPFLPAPKNTAPEKTSLEYNFHSLVWMWEAKDDPVGYIQEHALLKHNIKRLVLIHNPRTYKHTLSFNDCEKGMLARLQSHISIVEVESPAAEGEDEAWFAKHVYADSIWDLSGTAWLADMCPHGSSSCPLEASLEAEKRDRERAEALQHEQQYSSSLASAGVDDGDWGWGISDEDMAEEESEWSAISDEDMSEEEEQ